MPIDPAKLAAAFNTPVASGPATPEVSPEAPTGIWKALDVLARPGRAVAGTFRGGLSQGLENLTGDRADTFDDVLADQGVEDSFGRRAAGFGLDMVLDPLNLIPVTGVGKLLKAGGQAAKGALTAGLRATELGTALERRFVPYAGLEAFLAKAPDGATYNYRDARRLQESILGARREQAAEKVLAHFKDLTPEQAFEIPAALDEGRTLDAALEPYRLKAKELLDSQFAKEVAAGVMPEEKGLTNYITHLMKKDPMLAGSRIRNLNAKNAFVERTGPLTFREGAERGIFEKDLRTILEARLAAGDRAVHNAEFFKQTARDFGTPYTNLEALPAGLRPVAFKADTPLKNVLGKVAFPEAIAADLEGLSEIPKDTDAIGKLFRGGSQVYKGWLTRVNPAFHAGNAAGNVVQTWMGGLGDTGTKILDLPENLRRHVEAFGVMRDPMKLPETIGKYRRDDVIAALRDYGIVGGTHTSFNELEDLTKGIGQSRTAKLIDHTVGQHNPLLATGAKVGNAVENTSRIALFLDRLRKGDSMLDASMHVRKYLFDYGELTDFEKGIRDKVVPFYTWQRKNLPLQIANLVEQPDKMAALAKTVHAVDDMTQDRGLAAPEGSLPESMDQYIQLPIAGDHQERVFVNPRLPVQDLELLNLLNPEADQTRLIGEKLLSSVHPLWRVPAELGLNREAYSGREIAREGQVLAKADPLSAFLHRMAPEAAPVLGTTTTTRGVEMDPIRAYLMRQVPFTSRVGKLVAPETSEASINGVDPAVLSLLLGPTQTRTPEDLRKALKQHLQSQKAERTQTRRDLRRVQP